MRGCQCLAERCEFARLQEGRVLPFRQWRNALHRAAHRLGQRLGGQALRQAINRFMLRQDRRFLRRHDVIRVRHLRLVLEAIDAPRQHAPRSHRQYLGQPVGLSAEENQFHGRAGVRHPHFIGLAFDAWRQMVQHRHFHGGDAAAFGGRDGWAIGAIHHPHRQIQRQIAQQRSRHLGN